MLITPQMSASLHRPFFDEEINSLRKINRQERTIKTSMTPIDPSKSVRLGPCLRVSEPSPEALYAQVQSREGFGHQRNSLKH
jgi:hypothetical protein